MNLAACIPSRHRQWLRTAALVGASLAFGGAMAQKIDDVPPAVKNNVAPNFMFMIDRSGSMSNIVPAAPYSASGSYFTAACTGTSLVPAGTSVDLFINGSGAPRFQYDGNTYRHTTAPGSTATNSRCFDNAATYGARLLAPTGGYLDSEYSGHYLNWYFGNYDGPMTGWVDRKRVTTGAVESRIEIARAATTSVINSLPVPVGGANAPVRVGLSTYSTNARSGGNLRVPIGDLTSTSRTTLTTSIAGLTAAGATPLASTLADVGRYMATGYTGNVTTANGTVDLDALLRLDGTDATVRDACLENASSCTSASSAQPVQYWCQRSSVFMLTDGRPQGDRVFGNNANMRDYDRDCSGSNVNNCNTGGGFDRKNSGRTYESQGSDYMDDVAKALFDTDLRPDLVDSTRTPPAKPPGAKNNVVTYMIGFADPAVQNDPLLLNTANQGGGRFIAANDGPTLIDAFQDAITDAFAKDASAAAVAVTNAQITSGGIGYASSYNSGSWYGDLEAYSLDTATGLPLAGGISWSAQTRLDTLGESGRKIVSFNGTAGLPFRASNAGSFSGIAPTSTQVAAGMTAAGVINYVRGIRTGEGTTYRERTHLLGDIINAEPVVVDYPASGATVFQAANDGMLHVFDGRVATTAITAGQELWAYVPRLIHSGLPSLADPNYRHRYFVDGTPATAEITVAGVTSRILVGGLGKGGAGYYALDITDGTATSEAAAASKVKWEFSDPNMGYSFGTPLIVNTAAGYRVVVASGYRNDSAVGGLGGDGRGYVWVIDPSQTDPTTNIKVFVTPAGFGDPSASLGLAHLGKMANVTPDVAVRYVYGGDLLGNVWRFDLNAATGSAPVRIASLRGPTGAVQPVTAAPVVGPVSGSSTKLYVYVGTGQYLSDDDVPGSATPNAFATQTQTLYGIADDTSLTSVSPPDIRGSNGGTCPSNGGNGDFVCQSASQASAGANFTATSNSVNLSSKRGFYMDVPVTNGRVSNPAALTAGGTLVFVVNQPTNIICNPGGNSFFFQLSAASGGAVERVLGGGTYFEAGFLIANALSSRAVIVSSTTGPRGLFRLSDKTTQSRVIGEGAPCPPGDPTCTCDPSVSVCSGGPSPVLKRIYKRALN